MLKPAKLSAGDTVATISLSWGGAGELPHRYQQGKQQLQETFGLNVVETKHALKAAQWIADNPKARADDLHDALQNPEIKAIISNIGGDDSIRLLPYVDLEIIRKHPKIFLGFSDSTVTHFMFYKAGVTSFYGTSLLVGFAENGGMHEYQIDYLRRTLFSHKPIGRIHPRTTWTSEHLAWEKPELNKIPRAMIESRGWSWLNGKSRVRGELLGGCIEVLEFLKDTALWVKPADWAGKILFIETSEELTSPDNLKYWLRNYAASGILANINAVIVGRPQQNRYWREYDEVLQHVIYTEAGLTDLPIITGMDFGHSCPTFTIPIVVEAEIDCTAQSFSVLESGVC